MVRSTPPPCVGFLQNTEIEFDELVRQAARLKLDVIRCHDVLHVVTVIMCSICYYGHVGTSG